MSASFWLSWRQGLQASAGAAGEIHLQGPLSRTTLRRLPPATWAALQRLLPAGADEEQLADFVLDQGGPEGLAQWYYYLRQLTERGLCSHAVQADGNSLATLVVAAPGEYTPMPVHPERRYVLSRFAYLHREGGELLLESPLAHVRVVLNDCRSAALVAALAEPGCWPTWLAARRGWRLTLSPRCSALLGGAGMVQIQEDEDPALLSWEFHDLLFHARSRKGRSDVPYGATFRLQGRLDPAPVVKPVIAVEMIDLHRPDLERLQRDDPPLAQVQENRQSIRSYDAAPLTDRQLGEFLYRVARVKDFEEHEMPTPAGPRKMAFTVRPYPAGGAVYELEFYVAAKACANLAPGLYHYDPAGHRLGKLRGLTPEVNQLLEDAGLSTGIPAEDLQVLIILAARFQRVAWKYASLAYALILKHVGVVYQTMYLAATAMDLAPCAIGGGDSDLFARAAGTHYYAETSVGEFLLASRERERPE